LEVAATVTVDREWKINVALNRPTFSSSVLRRFSASRAVDGNPDSVMVDSSCFHSTSEAYPWWAVDLGAALSVFGILFTYGVPDHWAKNGVELTIDSGRYSVEAGILEPLSPFSASSSLTEFLTTGPRTVLN